jgi:hypothetical protein
VRQLCIALWLLAVLPAGAQTPDPFVRPPPTQSPSQEQAPNPGQRPGTPQAQTGATTTMEALVRQGFEIKSMERVSDRAANFMVLVQRGAEFRTCLLRVLQDANRNPRQESVCF